ncbi:O-acetyltransferase OatA [compost metagenome]|jgi:peptidoglycan/LPS O-acetylase OafA/YrhL
MTNVGKGRINDIEALRAVAIGFTLFMHMSWLFTWGNKFLEAKNHYFNFSTGVDLFFAISGFVIARSLLPQLDAARSPKETATTIAAFWIRRVFRIWPLSWLWLSVLGVCSLLLSTGPNAFAPVAVQFNDIVAAVLQVANIHWWQCVADKTRCGQTLVWWSLSLEEQFYIALPVAIIVFRKRLHLFLAAVVLIQFFLPRPPATASILWWIRTDALALGVLVAMLERTSIYSLLEPTFMAARRYGLPLVLLIVVLLAACTGIPGIRPDPAFFSTGIAAVLSALLVLIASYNKGYILTSRRMAPFILWLGSRSFAIYIIHTIMIGFTVHIWRWIEPEGIVFTGRHTLRFFLTWLILLVTFAELSYRFCEVPMREKGRELARRMLARGHAEDGVVNIDTGTLGSRASKADSRAAP